jgi:DUF971 family protein
MPIEPVTTSMTPSRIKLHRQARELELVYADGDTLRIPCELLRVYSPSAEVRGHGHGERKLQTGKKYVNIERIEPVGNYAIRIAFDDGHDSGIYSWEFLADLGRNQVRYWEAYLAELEAANASRLPAIPVGRWTP